ncbi:MAG: hypothetical protein OWR52_06480 [Acidibacillus sp.]|uniref:hypothetical protein n=1 Tax=Sulfoacidibacillus ferrooxidans TaxID=2005001 RepID=UPI001F508AB3|nr:hypothetical protein [Sulfoacidibacillus ferrooxidans]MCY0893135.1 hypothetical protein [Acidibacillus sp.]
MSSWKGLTMSDTFAVITRWIVVFLIIFLLCMVLVFSWMKRPKQLGSAVSA